MLPSSFMSGEDTDRLARIEEKLDRLLKVLDRFSPLLEKLAKNPFLKMGR